MGKGLMSLEPSGPSVSSASPPIHLPIAWGGNQPRIASTASTKRARSAGEDNAPHWLGVKVGWAHPGGTVAERLQMVADALDGVERAARS